MRQYAPVPQEVERWGKVLLDAAFEVHSILRSGFLERVYEDALCHEFTLRGAAVQTAENGGCALQRFADRGTATRSPDRWHGHHRDQGRRCRAPYPPGPVGAYLKATGPRPGYVINFNAPHLWEDICRVVLQASVVKKYAEYQQGHEQGKTKNFSGSFSILDFFVSFASFVVHFFLVVNA